MRADAETFEAHRPELVALAYRMLGDVGRAEDLVQEAWLRWAGRAEGVDTPRAFLVRAVANLCLNELDSARVRREESRGDRLPEPIDLGESGLERVEAVDRISMAFLVVLQRLTPAERATLLLHDVFDFSHGEIAALLDKTQAACRQLLARARENVARERRALEASREEHRAMLAAFAEATRSGDVGRLAGLLADDATLIVDAGPEGRRVGRIREVGRPVVGARKIIALLVAVGRASTVARTSHTCVLNGEPAIVHCVDGHPDSALFLSVEGGKIRHIFVQADRARLGHVGTLH
jgi:RNA polymerase sigma-70 factor, ECF subfamily